MRGVVIGYQERRIWQLHEEVDRVIDPDRIPTELRVPPLLSSYITD